MSFSPGYPTGDQFLSVLIKPVSSIVLAYKTVLVPAATHVQAHGLAVILGDGVAPWHTVMIELSTLHESYVRYAGIFSHGSIELSFATPVDGLLLK